MPHAVVSDGPRLAMVFSSGELQARGFKVNVFKVYVKELNELTCIYFIG